MPRKTKRHSWARWAADTAVRTARTFVQGFLSVVTLDQVTPHARLDLKAELLGGAFAGAYAIAMAFIAPANLHPTVPPDVPPN